MEVLCSELGRVKSNFFLGPKLPRQETNQSRLFGYYIEMDDRIWITDALSAVLSWRLACLVDDL